MPAPPSWRRRRGAGGQAQAESFRGGRAMLLSSRAATAATVAASIKEVGWEDVATEENRRATVTKKKKTLHCDAGVTQHVSAGARSAVAADITALISPCRQSVLDGRQAAAQVRGSAATCRTRARAPDGASTYRTQAPSPGHAARPPRGPRARPSGPSRFSAAPKKKGTVGGLHLCRVSQAGWRVRVHGMSSLQDSVQVAADGRLERLQRPTPLRLHV